MTLASAHQEPHRPSREAGEKPAANDFLRLDRTLRHELQRQFGHLTPTDLGALVVRRSLSSYADALGDLEIFDAQGKLLYEGRQFRSMTALWAAPGTATAACWSREGQAYAPPRHTLL